MVLYGTQYGTHMINACLMVHKRYTIWYTIQVELRTEGLTPRVGFRVLGYRESLGLRVKGELRTEGIASKRIVQITIF